MPIDCAFYDCSSLTGVYITDLAKWCGISLDDLDANPLSYAHNLYLNGTLVTDLVIPNSVTSIGRSAFYGCSGLTSITIPDSVTSIGRSAFYGCSGLTSITIPDSVTSIGDSAFYGCYKLVDVYNKSALDITAGSWKNGYVGYYAKAVYTQPYTSKLSTDENGYILYTDGDKISLIGYTRTETDLTLPDGITEINQYAFCGCSSLTSITIPDSVTSIGEYAFNGCNGLASITMSSSVRSIGRSAFYSCSGLKSINFDGTKSQWNTISKSDDWDEYIRFYTIHCTDGDITKR